MFHKTDNITATSINAGRIVKRSVTRDRLEMPLDDGTKNAIIVQVEHK